LLAGALAMLAPVAATPLPAPIASAAVDSESWADFSMMGKNQSGMLWSGMDPASRYQWVRISANESHIYWGEPTKKWPPAYHERFIRVGEWVMLDGWWGDGTYYTVRVDREEQCDAACEHCTLIASDGPQRYARWTVPSTPYCLKAKGTITYQEPSPGVIHFDHQQVYTPGALCSTSQGLLARCITQHETWWDDKSGVFEKRLERVNSIAKGIGGFRVDQVFPGPWHAEYREPSRD
jgi:hypothetical protein